MIDLTLLNQIVMLWGVYYGMLTILFLVKTVRHRLRVRRADAPAYVPTVVMVVPAHNEAAVLGPTLQALLSLDYPRLLVMVMNDGSTDQTAAVAKRFADTGRLMLVNRSVEVAGRGKGAVLNDAFARISELRGSDFGPLAGVPAHDVIVGVMDADGQLERQSLGEVVPLFADPGVGGVQVGVRIANARTNILTRLQDMEFVGFSAFVQEARDTIGSVGLGGNGQFTRLSALESLGRDPWTDCLTEDLDLGLSLVENGWRIRFASRAYVAQQGVVTAGPLLRQRTRWVQGHYQCWAHIPRLLDSDRVLTRTRLDLILYLVLVVFVLLITAGVVLSVASLLGLVVTTSSFLEDVPVGTVRNALQMLISFGPLIMFFAAYQARAKERFRWWEVPTFMGVFSVYTYVFVVSQVWALFRLITRRRSWAKTPRTEAETAV